ncbi:MAG: SpoIIE family protein phosphatase [Oligoflexia bacterium]|nr:SpoIIE family protein phosphatase [Oligoflexia bacterium]
MKLKSYAAKTDQGPYLNINEDGYDLDLMNDLFMIFDGFGGPGIGDKCVSVLKDNIRNFYSKVIEDPDSTMPFYYSYKYLLEGNALINAMHFTQKLLFKENKKVDLSMRAGSSSIVTSLSEDIMTFVSVGNCLCYLYRDGELLKIVNEDTIGIYPLSGDNSYLKTTPLSAFGLFEELHLQTREVKICEGDLFILMTDGAYSRIKPNELVNFIIRSNNQYNHVVEKIFETANTRGNLDNQTTILLQF